MAYTSSISGPLIAAHAGTNPLHDDFFLCFGQLMAVTELNHSLNADLVTDMVIIIHRSGQRVPTLAL